MSSGPNPAKPKLACEIASDRVLAGRLAENGHMVEMCAAQELAPGIVVADLVESKLELATDLGATHVVHAGRQDVVEVVRGMGREGVDYAFEAIGNERTLAQAVRALRPGGTAVAIGLPPAQASVSVKIVDLVTLEKTLKGSIYGSTRPYADIPRLFDLYRRGRLPLDRLLTRRYPLGDINEAYRALLAGEVARSVVIP